MKTKITVDIQNRVIELTVNEARLLQKELNEIFFQEFEALDYVAEPIQPWPPVDEEVEKEIYKYFSNKEAATKKVWIQHPKYEAPEDRPKPKPTPKKK